MCPSEFEQPQDFAMRCYWLIPLLCLLHVPIVNQSAFADEEDDRPGILLQSEKNNAVIQPRPFVDWDVEAPFPGATRSMNLMWTGKLLVRHTAPHVFFADLRGNVVITIDDSVVLSGSGQSHFLNGNSVALQAGEHQIRIEYRPLFNDMPVQSPRLALFWSSPEFTLEPLPADSLFIPASETGNSTDSGTRPNNPTPQPAFEGLMTVDAARCGACHRINAPPSRSAPDLAAGLEFIQDHDIIRRLTTAADNHRMPHFALNPQQASDVLAFLRGSRRETPQTKKPAAELKEEDVAAGRKLLATTGCAACHRLPESYETAPKAAPYDGPDLRTTAAKRSQDWLLKWLKNPESLNRDHTMPRFQFDDKQRQHIVAAFLAYGTAKTAVAADATPEVTNEGSPERGKDIVQKARCASCHRIEGVPEPTMLPSPTFDKPGNVESCVLAANPDDSTAESYKPHYGMTPETVESIRFFLASTTPLNKENERVTGQLLLHRNGCVACHDRDTGRGLSSLAAHIESQLTDLRGQSQALIPPSLIGVGDRLRDEVLMSAVQGAPKTPRLPWLLVQMPHFEFTETEQRAIVAHLIAHDRIPESADGARTDLFEHYNPQHPEVAATEDLLTGNHLAGAGGFNCIACHKAGAFEPRNVAMGTRGSDLMLMGQRLRSRYFLRWMKNPIRVVPGVEMPALRKAVTGVHEDSLSKQIAVLWKALSDPGFSPPTVASRFEQFLTLRPGDSPRVLRDVFTISADQGGGSVPRALAMGFGNGHNVLMDLDTGHLRQWTFGEFARQRTEGKSWFWDMAGIVVMPMDSSKPWCQLVHSDSQRRLGPVRDESRLMELLGWRQDVDSVTWRMRIHFNEALSATNSETTHSARTAWNHPDRPLHVVVLKFTCAPLTSHETAEYSGLRIQCQVEQCPDGWSLEIPTWKKSSSTRNIPAELEVWRGDAPTQSEHPVRLVNHDSAELRLRTARLPQPSPAPDVPILKTPIEQITAVPGFNGQRQPLPAAIMPTALTWLDDHRLAITSLKGHIWIAADNDHDGSLETLTLFAEGLAAPYGIVADGDAIMVSHKPEVLRLRDRNGDGRADEFDVVASGWGFSDDYHDWTTGLTRGPSGEFYVGLGSDYSQSKRPADNDRWRGTILRIASGGEVTPVAYSFRFPMGLALDHSQRLFVTDNQGVQNTFNEINLVLPDKHYGVPSRHEVTTSAPIETPALMVPHPWTRSVNSIVFLPEQYPIPELAGHGIGCEYDTRCLIRFTTQDVNGVVQGACYRFSRVQESAGGSGFVGPISSTVAPDGSLWIGSIWDSGWQGGPNTGCIERLRPDSQLPNGIREVRAVKQGFQVTFFRPVEPAAASTPGQWNIQGYTRNWQGSYATPDSDRHNIEIHKATVSDDRLTVHLETTDFKSGYVYEIRVNGHLDSSGSLWPDEAHYTMKVVP